MRTIEWVTSLGLVAWFCCLSPGPVQGGKILVMPVDGSHWLSMKILVEELSLRGHEVVVLVPDKSLLIKGSDTYRTEVFTVSYTQEDLDESFNQLKRGIFNPPAQSVFVLGLQLLLNFTDLQMIGCESLLQNEALLSRLRGGGFDALLTDPFLPCGPILAHLFSIPTVYFLHAIPCMLHLKVAQCPSPPSYIPVFNSGNSPKMNFVQRVKNMFIYFKEAMKCKVMYASYDNLTSRYVGESMTYGDLLSNDAIWLVKYDFTFEWPRPIMPNIVYIGGISCEQNAPLPADLEEFVDGSGEDGFIIFTLGSMVPDMPEEIAKQFFDAFRQIPQRVLWRYTGAPPKDVPKNVRLMKWLPQNDLLAHPKVKLFLTHGGANGMYEGICHAVPMVMFPLFADQDDNAFRMVTRGVAEKLSIRDVTTEALLAAIKKITHDKSYKEKMVELSQIYLDRPVPPLDLAVFWTEFVMKHKGAAHLRVAAHDLNWIQYHSLDVIGFLILILITVVFLTLKCCLFCTRRCCRKGTAKRKLE